ncbi:MULTISPECIES: hypothetical protein [Streptosporangium]|uniref:HNH endonuclease n=1 Tax=Streptosporangium brasiliense TaxID=47480 RepID=A0ABT9R6J4_9ACTN|nr:hypothetical protein [Streptosporangium brasiliense]MDP9864873.1 hypothetical protein [Streptosporangium brasiliense]
MSKTAYVYVPRNSIINFTIGIDNGIWGWHSATLGKAGGRETIVSLKTGDYLMFGHRGPNSRVAADGWRDAHLQRVVVGQITRPLYTDASQVWPDDIYPERVDVDILSDDTDVTGAMLAADAMEALRMSANKQGSAVLSSSDAVLALAATRQDAHPQDASKLGDLLTIDGSTDVVRMMLGRREQQKLRGAKFGKRTLLTCALCGRTLPRKLMRLAHIKLRSRASHTERLDLNNVMGACLAGCDALFEYGYIYVDNEGVIRSSIPETDLSDLGKLARELVGRRCAEHNADSDKYFAFHRAEVVKGSLFPLF